MGKKNKKRLSIEVDSGDEKKEEVEEPLLESGMSDRIGEAPEEKPAPEVAPLEKSETVPKGMNINASDLSKGMGSSIMSSQNEKEVAPGGAPPV